VSQVKVSWIKIIVISYSSYGVTIHPGLFHVMRRNSKGTIHGEDSINHTDKNMVKMTLSREDLEDLHSHTGCELQ
jgi:hypothetical protein